MQIIWKHYSILHKELEHHQILVSRGGEGGSGTNPLWILDFDG